ncbi:hypothetical protein [Lactococcus cremoris]|uniref:hypothetical protein n=1 Tax=Lactococcus lactis subsp. cremoris TaxID=1359 RepID=UPI0021AA1850|nr:hypothetical protein [Lactococcus cremoris]
MIVKVDSQQTGNSKISNASNGIIDKAVDLWTSGSKAQEFLGEQSQDSIYETSNFVMRDKGRQKKVAKYASEDLESLLNLNSDKRFCCNVFQKIYFSVKLRKKTERTE